MNQFISFLQLYPQSTQLIGVLGFLIYIASFYSIQSGRLCGNGIVFPILQVLAASCVLVSLASAYNLASFLIQTSYIMIGLYGISRRLKKPRPAPTGEIIFHSGASSERGRKSGFGSKQPTHFVSGAPLS